MSRKGKDACRMLISMSLHQTFFGSISVAQLLLSCKVDSSSSFFRPISWDLRRMFSKPNALSATRACAHAYQRSQVAIRLPRPCIHICMRVHVCVYWSTYTVLYVYAYVCLYIYMYVCIHIYVHIAQAQADAKVNAYAEVYICHVYQSPYCAWTLS